MQRLRFSDNKRLLLEFAPEALEFEKQEADLLLTCSGEVITQDSGALEDLLNGNGVCHVELEKDGEIALSGKFKTTFFTYEPDMLAVLLSNT